MPKRKVNLDESMPSERPPAVTMEGRENQLIALATDWPKSSYEKALHHLRLSLTT